jgi:hypothetical protein
MARGGVAGDRDSDRLMRVREVHRPPCYVRLGNPAASGWSWRDRVSDPIGDRQ